MSKSRSALYCRVSDRKQIDRYSLDVQEQMLKEYAEQHDMDVVAVFVEKGKSAKSLNRPQLQACLQGVKAGKFDVLLVLESDRLTRSVPDLYVLMETLHAGGCQLIPILEPAVDFETSDGIFTQTIRATVNQRERHHNAERVRRSMAKRAQAGGWNGYTPYGYATQATLERILREGGESESKAQIEAATKCPERSKLYPYEPEAETLKLIFRLYLQTNSLRKTALLLNERGIPTRKGSKWNGNILSGILHNPVYTGRVVWGNRKKDRWSHESIIQAAPDIDTQGAHEPLVSVEDFEAVQQVLAHGIRPTRAKREYLLSGIVYCGLCGGKMSGNAYYYKKKTCYRYYICQTKKRYGTCNATPCPADELEEKVVNALMQYSDDNDFLHSQETLLSNVFNRIPPETSAETKEIDAKIKDVSMSMDALLNAMLKEGFDDQVIRGKYDALKTDLERLEAEKRQEQRKCREQLTQYEALKTSLERLRSFRTAWEDATDRPKFLRSIVDRVTVFQETAEVVVLTENVELLDFGIPSKAAYR